MAISPRLRGRGFQVRLDSPDPGKPRQLRRAGLGMLVILASSAVFHLVPAFASSRLGSELFSWVFVVGTSLAYWRGYLSLKASPGPGPGGERRAIVGFAVAFGLASLIVPPFNSTDVYCYINRGWQQAGYGLNPYVHPLVDTPNWRLDPMFRPHWTGAVSPYGFLFEWLARAICRLGNGDWLGTLLLFKLVGLVVFGLTGWVVWKGCRWLGFSHPDRVLYLFLWNPVVIAHSLINGHNDLWMGLFASVGVLSTVMGGWPLAAPALMAGALIKYASAALLPFTTLYLGRRVGWPRAWAGAGLAAIVFAPLAWPYIPGDWRLLVRVHNGANATIQNSPAAMVYSFFDLCAKPFPALKPHLAAVADAIRIASWAGFLLFYASLAWRRVRGGPYDRAAYLHDCVLIQFALICLASSKYYAWYLGMFYPLALWLPEGDRLRRVILSVTGAHILSLTFVSRSRFLDVAAMLLIPMIRALSSTRPATGRTRRRRDRPAATVPVGRSSTEGRL